MTSKGKKGPTFGWSKLSPAIKGWFEIAEEKEIESSRPKAVRVWSDGLGSLFVPSEVTQEGLAKFRLTQANVIDMKRMGVIIHTPGHLCELSDSRCGRDGIAFSNPRRRL